MKLPTVLALAALLPAAVLAGPAPQIICNDGPVPGKLCVSDCKSDGLYFPAPGGLIPSINLPDFTLSFDGATTPATVTASANNVSVGVGIPTWLGFLGSKFLGVGSEISFGGPGQPAVATVVTPDYVPASGTVKEGVINLSLKDQAVKVKDTKGLGAFLKNVLAAKGFQRIRLQGFADAKADIINDPFGGNSCLRYIPFDLETSTLKGLEGLQDLKVVGQATLLKGTPDALTLSVPVTLSNPSNIGLTLRSTTVTLPLSRSGVALGTIALPAFSLPPNAKNVPITATATIARGTDDATKKAVDALVSDFSGGKAVQVDVAGGKAKGIEVLDEALGALRYVGLGLPSNTVPLIKSATADSATLDYPDPDNGFVVELASTLVATNPFDVPITVNGIAADLTYQGAACVRVDTSALGFKIPPRSEGKSPVFKIRITTTDPKCDEFVQRQLFGDTVLVDVASKLAVAVDGFEGVTLTYAQGGVSVNTV
ncbi:hypothetical protein HDU96_010954 [Phlyctochytrium bullatum]|nr:hypothetical protein HDU96_010954 [Phlyctochytrium bullatum]